MVESSLSQWPDELLLSELVAAIRTRPDSISFAQIRHKEECETLVNEPGANPIAASFNIKWSRQPLTWPNSNVYLE